MFSYIFNNANIYSFIDFLQKYLHHQVLCGAVQINVIIWIIFDKQGGSSSNHVSPIGVPRGGLGGTCPPG